MWLRNLFCFCLAFFVYSKVLGQVVQFKNLTFSSETERKCLEAIVVNKDTSDFVPLFFAAQHPDIKENIDQRSIMLKKTIDNWQKEIENQKSNSKKVKWLYNKIHSSYFKKYELKSKFGEIFTTGTYNCLTATALYAMVFDQLHIPYLIKNLPTHVYLVAYPDVDNIIIETTTPNFGYYKISEAVVARYLEKLRKLKIISEDEFNSGNKDALFEKYYFKDKKINLHQLAGLYYYNLALYASEDKMIPEVLAAAKKSYILYPSEESEYILEGALKSYLAMSKYTSDSDADDFISLVKIGSISKTNENEILAYFDKMYYEQLIAKSNFEAFKRSYEKISLALDSGAIKNEIDFKYNYEVARVNYNLGNNVSAEKYILKAFELQPENAEVVAMVSRILKYKVFVSSNSKNVLEFLQKLILRHPNVDRVNAIKDIFLICYLDQAKYFYTNKNSSVGDQMLYKFEKLAEGYDLSSLENINLFLDLAYTSGAVEHFRLGDNSKSRKIILAGLKYFPGDDRLQEMLKTIK